jgi:hypothetical protein
VLFLPPPSEHRLKLQVPARRFEPLGSPISEDSRPPEHPDQHRPERPVLLAVDQQLGEGANRCLGPVKRSLRTGADGGNRTHITSLES